MKHKKLFFPFVLAATLRFTGLAWDGWYHQHPDERFLVMVAESLSFPKSLGEALDPNRTPLNPQNHPEFGFYVYGALFPNLNFTVAKLFGLAHYRGLLQTGRVLASLFDCLTLWVLSLTAWRLAGPGAATTVAWLYAFSGLLVQNARFGTPDALGMLAVALCLAFSLRAQSTPRAALAGLAVGLAAAVRPNLVTMALPVSLALLLMPLRKPTARPWLSRVLWLLVAGGTALVTWKLLDPGFFATTFSPLPHPRRLASFRELAGFVSGEGQYPPNLQWADRGPVFLLSNYLFWGLGPALGLAFAWSLVGTFKRALLGDRHTWVMLAWLVPVTAFQATRLVCSARHYLGATPFFFLLLAIIVRRWPAKLRVALVVLTLPWGLAWAARAWQPYTRLEASEYLRAHFPPETVIATEAWDDGLPIDYGAERFRYREIPVYAPDTQEKREQLLAILHEAKVIVLSSQRGVGSICRVPDAYPLMSEFYHLLFGGQLGFRLVHSQERRLGWGRWGLSDLGAEEAFSVYDHPPVWIFAKDASYNPEMVTHLLARVRLPENTDWHTRELEARGLPPYLKIPAQAYSTFFNWGRGFLAQGASTLLWLLWCEWLGLLATVWLVHKCGLGRPAGSLLARPLAFLVLGMVLLWTGTLGMPRWQWLPWVVVALILSWRWRFLLWSTLNHAEVGFARHLFVFTFIIFLAIRAFNPEIYWGEKPMDSAIFFSLVRSPSVPLADPWFAGYPINYYFFGFLPHVALASASLAHPAVAFNLAAATVPALTFLGAASVSFTFCQRKSSALLGGVMAQLAGTAYLLVRPGHLLSPNFDRFWASSRVIPEGINEYPVWTALFADLHAHFLSFPGFLTTVALLLFLAQGWYQARSLLFPLALALAAQYMSNTWEMPALAFLFMVAVGASMSTAPRPYVCGLWFGARTLFFAALLTYPFLSAQHLPQGRFFLEKGQGVTWDQYLELYGVHGVVFLLVLVAAWQGLSWVPHRWFVGAVALLATAYIWGPVYFTLVDKMNTYFKLGLQAFLLLGAFAGGLWGKSYELSPTWPRRLLRGCAWALMAVGLAQATWNAWAVVTTRRLPGPRPTLDGQAYLRSAQPPVAVAAERCQKSPLGVVAEEASPSYGDNLRLPMFCGVPAMVGWDYHLWQRGKSQAEIRLRMADLDLILRGSPPEMAKALANRWDIDWRASWQEPPSPLPDFEPLSETDGRVWVRSKK
ncbi:hypothetical protein EG19_10205 [Thermoanaerobaculum aquaticum]|uniref:Glycosyltransferase RgtA/B/C/D-like domain-containing protein n=1 Tax=Thermoanaerobaculum aquaticum TaxID=1312852 RepID=A0A062Y182_9BACT|nr:DUF2298 domain-containing protein [Thermoanaerobaculum aquaticum]KDA54530.1 hypothetical protein EG19_10205 [Thermoanaerobaculum aquaticum]